MPETPEAEDEAPRHRHPKSELDRQVKLTQQIEWRWRQLNLRFQEAVVQAFADDLAKRKQEANTA